MTLLPPLIVLGRVAFDGSRGRAAGTTGLFLALAVAFVAVWQCPVPLWQKIVACLVYAPLMTALLFGVAVSYVCGVHDNCL